MEGSRLHLSIVGEYPVVGSSRLYKCPMARSDNGGNSCHVEVVTTFSVSTQIHHLCFLFGREAFIS